MTGSWRTATLVSAIVLLVASVAAAFACDAGFLLLPGILLAIGLVLVWRQNLGGPVTLLIVGLPLLLLGGNGLITNGDHLRETSAGAEILSFTSSPLLRLLSFSSRR